MKLKIATKIKSSDGLLVVPVFQENLKNLSSEIPAEIREFIAKRIKNDQFEAKADQRYQSYFEIKGIPERVLILGLGYEHKFEAAEARNFGAEAGKAAKALKVEEITILATTKMRKYSQEIFEGVMISIQEFDQYKTQKSDKPYQLKLINFVVQSKSNEIEKAFEKAELIAEAVEFTKDLVNTPANFLDINALAEKARSVAKENRYKLAIFGEKELRKMGWGGILAVNHGSEQEARVAVLQYDGAKSRKEKPIILVGKGVIFDTGGYNLKPGGHIETMHQDMAGAASVLGTMKVIKRLGIKKNVIGIIGITDNMVNEKAYRPSDIITMFSGKTVEITNTDAEGRLVLADCLHYATKLDPELMITIATLTGAVGVALGNRYAGVLGNDADLLGELKNAGESVDDLMWPLPIHPDDEKTLDSKIADIRNHDLTRFAGSCKGAAFLKRFVGENKWAHIDIGGTAYTESPKPYEQKGSTAHGVRTLIRFLEGRS